MTPLHPQSLAENESDSQAIAHREWMMVGTSPGIHKIHDPASLPIDTVAYAIRADMAAHARDAEGIFFALDRRLDVPSNAKEARKDADAIRRRTEQLRELIGRLTSLRFQTESELDAEELEQTLQEWPWQMFPDRYTHWQTAVVLQALGIPDGRRNGRNLSKFGWAWNRDSSGNLQGGEVAFDDNLPSQAGIEYIYTAPGYASDGSSVAPYLLNMNQGRTRLAIPNTSRKIDAELQKIQPGISRIAYDTWYTTSGVLLGEQQRESLNDDALIGMPLADKQKLPVTDVRELNDLRERVHAALSTLFQ